MSGSTNLSFKFSKTSRKQLIIGKNKSEVDRNRNIDDDDEKEINSEPQLVAGLGQGFPKLDQEIKEKEKELIIPPLKNTIGFSKPELVPSTTATIPVDDPDSLAKRALIEEAQSFNRGNISEINVRSSIVVENQSIIDSSSNKIDYSTTVEADYDSIAVDDFGKALLRGMGWREGQAIGRQGKKISALVVTAPRPKGLGLGAQIKPPLGTTPGSTRKEGENENLVLKIGAYVKRIDAKGEIDNDRYGKVIGWDEDLARIVVETAIGKSKIRLSQHLVQVVDKKEFEKEGKCINRKAYDEYKDKEKKSEKRNGDDEQDVFILEKKSGLRKEESTADKNGKYKNEKRRDESPSSSKRDKKEKSHSSQRDRSRSPVSKSWLRPDIRVRIVDEKYRRGKYFKTKAVVVDVKSKGVCSCLADDEKTILDDLSDNMLETVVPRKNGAAVLIVRGSSAGKVGTILERDSDSGLAVVRLIDGIKNLSFDDICEYVGEMPEF